MEFPEIAALGIYDSNIVIPNTNMSKNRKVTMFEIELPFEDGGISYVDSSSEAIRTNTLICAKPGQTRHTKFPLKTFYIHMIVQPGILYDTLMKTPDFLKVDNPDVYREIFVEMINRYNDFSQSESLMVQSKILELIYLINKHTHMQYQIKTSSNNIYVTKRSIDYINSHLTDDLSLETLAKYNSLSPIHFHNMFKKSTGKTLRNYVEEQRIKKSINLLITTSLTLTQIAYECGFSSQSYFSYAFRRKMNCSPREYVRKINNKYYSKEQH